ncbi:unnamed protein product [Psylliodes chrysocephalus]|uniref:C2 domain-containing protein n=1 Tax=Psylliodes chrysocephalus TaxID=3402493 RepID=A0A9P0GDI1_9CUCU|nr:unnamed protein product [Psylliodes chrysocephala]
MEETVNTVKNYFKKKTLLSTSTTEDVSRSGVPQLGFRVSFCESSKELKVKVIGARQLPTDYGSVRPRGYLVKVVFYPQKQKFETKTAKDSWPTINEEFTCIVLPLKKIDDFLKGYFVSFTIYAILGKEEEEQKQMDQPRSVLKKYFSFTEGEQIFSLRKSSFRRSGSQRRSSYNGCLNNRRTVGAVTYNLDRKFFTQKLRTGVISTPDIWRNVAEITSGFQTQPRDGTKGSIELTLQYGVSEDGTNDVVEVTVTKFRCSLQTMQLHEKIGGQLYIKITAFEDEDLIQKMKSDKFEPTISLKLEAPASTLRATVNKYNLGQVKILIRLMSRTIVGKKTMLGKIEIDRHSSFWKEIVASPSVNITKMVNFE